MYQVIYEERAFNYIDMQQFKTRKEAWTVYAGLYRHALDNYGCYGTVLKMLSPSGDVLYFDVF